MRAIRETWGADSGTNVIRRETFYRDQMKQKTWLRVHVIPPLDGIYAQWDFNAGGVDTFYNSRNPEGVTVDGRNDEASATSTTRATRSSTTTTRATFDQNYRTLYRELQFCEFPYHLIVDAGDPTFAEANAALELVAGLRARTARSSTASPPSPTRCRPAARCSRWPRCPYYRDDSCFDDGTGSNPGPKLQPALRPTSRAVAADGSAAQVLDARGRRAGRRPDASTRARSAPTACTCCSWPTPTTRARRCRSTEIINDWQMVMLPGDPGNVGERYGRSLEKPLVATSVQRADFVPDLLP